MGAAAPISIPWTRRKAVALAVLGLGVVQGLGFGQGLGFANADAAALFTVSRKRLLNETAHAQALRQAEIELTAELQRWVDAIKAELSAEEQELARLRPTLDGEVFAARVAAFDRKVRGQRREAQKYATILQNAFRAERRKLVDALGPLLEEARAARGASVILNADQVLAADPEHDITDEVIARFNATVPPPVIPGIEVRPPVQPPAQEDEQPPQ